MLKQAKHKVMSAATRRTAFLNKSVKKAGILEIKISDVGIHSGLDSTIIIRPKKSGGIVFIRNGIRTAALYKNVFETGLRNTTIGKGEGKVQTIEHLMAALYVSEIADAEITIDNVETPILDGSAYELIKKLEKIRGTGAGFIRIKKDIVARADELKIPIWLRFLNLIKGRKRQDGFVRLSPSANNVLEISARLIYKEPVIGDQSYKFVFDYDNFEKSAAAFVRDIAKSRTFGKIGEWEWLKRHGMGKGATERNVIAINETEDGTLNKLYYPDEFVRHKIIDAVGDLYTAGGRIVGKIQSVKGSHALNNLALKKLFKDPDNYDIIRV